VGIDIRFSTQICFLFLCPSCGCICGCIRFDCVFCLCRNACAFRISDLPRKVGKECYDCRTRRSLKKGYTRIEITKPDYPKKKGGKNDLLNNL